MSAQDEAADNGIILPSVLPICAYLVRAKIGENSVSAPKELTLAQMAAEFFR